LTEVVGLVAGLEQRLGPVLFKELLALHFSPTRPHKDEWRVHIAVHGVLLLLSHAEPHPDLQ